MKYVVGYLRTEKDGTVPMDHFYCTDGFVGGSGTPREFESKCELDWAITHVVLPTIRQRNEEYHDYCIRTLFVRPA